MKFLKPLLSIEQQLQNLPKLYRSHIWVTPPGQDGFSYLGISDYAKKHFVRFNKLDFQDFPKTNYGIKNRESIELFIQETKEKKEKGQLTLSEVFQWQRFEYKQGQPFTTMQTIQFDVQLQAPVNIRIIELEFNCFYFQHLLSAPYFFKVEALKPQQLMFLDNEEKYSKSRKLIF